MCASFFPKVSANPGAESQSVWCEEISAADLGRCSSPSARALLPFEIAARLPALPLGVATVCGENVATVAVPRGRADELVAEVRFALGMVVRCVEIAPEILREAIVDAYHGDERRFTSAIELLRGDVAPAKIGLPPLRPASGDAAQTVATIIEYAAAQSASDLHFVPRRDGVYLRIRIGGELRSHDEPLCSPAVYAQMVARLKVLARLDTTQRTTPQDGAFIVPREGARELSARVAIMPTIHGEKVVIRFLGTAGAPELGRLGLGPLALEEMRRFIARREGLALFSGPTGSGKSTSIYAALVETARSGRSVVTIEDPVEQEIVGISQTSLDEKIGLDYPAALKAVLRQDPDVIALGEVRDGVSARTAFQAALTGHLVIGTVHARRSFDVPNRVIQLGVEAATVADALRLIVCQRLVPLLCRACKVIDLAASNRLGVSIYREVGCARCDYAGFAGRQVIAECIVVNEAIATVIASKGGLRPSDVTPETPSLADELRRLLGTGLISIRHFTEYGGG